VAICGATYTFVGEYDKFRVTAREFPPETIINHANHFPQFPVSIGGVVVDWGALDSLTTPQPPGTNVAMERFIFAPQPTATKESYVISLGFASALGSTTSNACSGGDNQEWGEHPLRASFTFVRGPPPAIPANTPWQIVALALLIAVSAARRRIARQPRFIRV
jgi:hypothetical protein